jgi:hypothetical protein
VIFSETQLAHGESSGSRALGAVRPRSWVGIPLAIMRPVVKND